tara:strand:+ start:175 stop:297 length:123 start_codon:yes stop_codon:yes gene_type:complete
MMRVDIKKNIQDVVLFVLTKKSMAVFIIEKKKFFVAKECA